MLTYPLYNLAWAAASPLARCYLRIRPRHRPLRARFHVPEPVDAPPVWVQACSVGEVAVARPIITALEAALPGTPIVLSTSTIGGHAEAERKAGSALVRWFPMDAPGVVRRYVRTLQPQVLVLVETEIWPNVIREASRAGVPVVVVNGRISDRQFPKLQRWAAWLRPVFSQLNAAGMQNECYAERLAALGTPAERVEVTGNAKFDSVQTELDSRERVRLRARMRIPADAPLLVFGSTGPGEEALAVACWHSLRERWPKLRLVIAPRHLHRVDGILARLNAPHVRRSALDKSATARDAPVILLDTFGELGMCYSMATVAVVGGCFFSGMDGQNPLEPAALGVPTIFGPFMDSFRDSVQVLLDANAAHQVDKTALCDTLAQLFENPGEARRLGTRARKAVLDNRGAVARNVDLVLRAMGGLKAGTADPQSK